MQGCKVRSCKYLSYLSFTLVMLYRSLTYYILSIRQTNQYTPRQSLIACIWPWSISFLRSPTGTKVKVLTQTLTTETNDFSCFTWMAVFNSIDGNPPLSWYRPYETHGTMCGIGIAYWSYSQYGWTVRWSAWWISARGIIRFTWTICDRDLHTGAQYLRRCKRHWWVTDQAQRQDHYTGVQYLRRCKRRWWATDQARRTRCTQQSQYLRRCKRH